MPLVLPSIRTVRGSILTSGRVGAPVLDGDIDAVAVPIAPIADESDELTIEPRPGTADIAAAYRIDLADVAVRERLRGRAGETYVLSMPRPVGPLADAAGWDRLPKRIVLVGVGDESPAAYRRAGAALARATAGFGTVVTTVATGERDDVVHAFSVGFLLAGYRRPFVGVGSGPVPAPIELVLLGKHSTAAVDSARIVAESTCMARDLANMPSNVKNPQWLADEAAALASSLGLELDVWDEDRLRADGFTGILAVGAGSVSPPRFVRVSYVPESPSSSSKHIVIVGKGITYDTGGLSIKPRESMVPMKTDMTGSAVALAVVAGAARSQVRHQVTALMPLAENAFSGSAYRPSDVVTIYGGTTVEVANTDAEGRIVLADALAYADAELDPDWIVDVATLTGAATLGLGKQYAALYASDERLATALVDAGERSGERVWRMPLVEEYLPAISSEIADLRQVPASATSPGGGGSITAALFLRSFVGTRRWAHLDIAGPGRASADSYEISEGATGFGVRVLLDWVAGVR